MKPIPCLDVFSTERLIAERLRPEHLPEYRRLFQDAQVMAICYTLTTNRASQRVMEKLGFRFEKEMIHAGLPHVFYRMTAADFRG